MFTDEKVFLDGTAFPLGQFTTDILNLDETILDQIEQSVRKFLPSVQIFLQEKTDSAAQIAQKNLNAIWDKIFQLPVYRDLHMDTATSYNLFPDLLSTQDKWNEILNINSEERQMFEGFLSGLKCFSDSLCNFRGQITGMLDLYFEPLSRRNKEAYAEAFTAYFSGMRSAGSVFYPDHKFEQSYPVQICFVPKAHPTEERKAMIAEKAIFQHLSHFLYTEFYRGPTA